MLVPRADRRKDWEDKAMVATSSGTPRLRQGMVFYWVILLLPVCMCYSTNLYLRDLLATIVNWMRRL